MDAVIISCLILLVAMFIGLYGVFQKAGQKGILILVPIYNLYIWLKIVKKPLWWMIFLILPYINVFMLFLLFIETLKAFNKDTIFNQVLCILFPFVFFPIIGFNKSKYIHPDEQVKVKKSATREWTEAIIFAVIAATIIRTFLIEAYTIPTSSMEKSMLVGDFLFVSKIAYGSRTPMTPIAMPFAHHTLPLTKSTKSYLEWIKLPYYRFPGYTNIKRNDVVVFNYPDGDTVALNMQNVSYYKLVRDYGLETVKKNDLYDPRTNRIEKNYFGKITARPLDKRENYIKRCVGMPGDTVEIIDKQLFINNQIGYNPPGLQYQYIFRTNGTPISERTFRKYNILSSDIMYFGQSNSYIIPLTEELVPIFRSMPNLDTMAVFPSSAWDQDMFPHSEHYPWNRDNYGPIIIPKQGVTVKLDTVSILLYERIIKIYENNDLEIKNGNIYINGVLSSTYTFKQDYYWMMGDNRHNSADSRMWGFVPHDHVVGKAAFVWLSLDKDKTWTTGKIRFNKMFRRIK